MNPEFVWHMEDVLDLYHEPYDAKHPVICIDESPVQLLKDVYPITPPKNGKPLRYDYEYEKHGTSNLFVVAEPLTGWRHIEVTEHRTKVDYAYFMQNIAQKYFSEAESIRVVQDNLNTHTPASFYESFPPIEARALTQKFEFHFTPKHGSWLNIAEIEFSVATKQCLKGQRFGSIGELKTALAAWEQQRNLEALPVQWRFSTTDARIKLKRLYTS